MKRDEFLVEIYRNQYEQRWRGSRNQDWTLLGVIATLVAASTAIFVESGDENAVLLIILPAISVAFSIVGLILLRKHQIVMDHAVHIANGIEKHFCISKVKGNETVDCPFLEDPLFVGVREGDEKFRYPDKGAFLQENKANYCWRSFLMKVVKVDNVQSGIGWIYLLAIASQVWLTCQFLTSPWGPAEYQKSDAEMAADLEAALEEGDTSQVATVLGDIARSQGMSALARETGLAREGLDKALSPMGNPELETILKVVEALGLQLHASTAE